MTSRGPSRKATLWMMIDHAAHSGWATTFRVVLMLMLIGAILVAIAVLGVDPAATNIWHLLETL